MLVSFFLSLRVVARQWIGRQLRRERLRELLERQREGEENDRSDGGSIAAVAGRWREVMLTGAEGRRQHRREKARESALGGRDIGERRDRLLLLSYFYYYFF